MPDLTIGNYEIDEDGNGDLVIKDQNDTVVFKYDDTAGSFKPQVNFDFGSNDISNVGSVNTESLVIGGTLYEEDDNSPIDASNTASVTHQMADDSDEVIIIPEKGFYSFMDGLRVNGDSGDNYSTTDSSDSQQTGLTEFQYKSFHGWQYLVLHSNAGDRIAYGGVYADEYTGVGLRGHNDDVTPTISQFTILRRDGTQLDAKARVFRRVMNI